MPNLYGAPEISAKSLARKFENGQKCLVLDVREPHELERAKLADDLFTLVPLSQLAAQQLAALPAAAQHKEAEIIVICRSGVRSAQVTAWLRQHGWTNVFSLEGGILAYGRDVDNSIRPY